MKVSSFSFLFVLPKTNKDETGPADEPPAAGFPFVPDPGQKAEIT